MDKTLYEMIYKRKSFHIFRNVGNESISGAELDDIQNAYTAFIPLNPGIKTAIRIVPEEQTNCKRGGEYCVLLYSEKKDGYLQNIGYLGEQLDLYLVSRNIGALWFGIGKTQEKPFEDMEFVIMFSVRKISDGSKYRKDMFKSKRKSAEEIWEGEQIPGVSDIVRFAPSACNSQPWLVKNNGELSVYRYMKPGKRGIMPADKVSFYNRIDIGIFICFMDICLEYNGVEFEKTLYSDAGGDKELVLNAKYRLCSLQGEKLHE
ncbi:nitroreductase family protein [Butyrivibrio sp. CB08]|uniref:nitroreductase family protein n=1 Tax=Butyrivibrio sp. CB08 TaxID=2364879 RepID=UPI001FAA5982|nr:nitroreductase family protein [Butyrivibrio sp. CB08]